MRKDKRGKDKLWSVLLTVSVMKTLGNYCSVLDENVLYKS